MEMTRILWIGAGLAPEGASLLHGAGFRVETGRGSGDADLVVIASDPPPFPLIAALPAGARALVITRDADGVAQALAAGAVDALVASDVARQLVHRVHNWTRTVRAERHAQTRTRDLERELQESEERMLTLEALAHEDELTGLGNRRSLRAALAYALEYGTRYGGALSLVMADLDGMKAVNDRLGHPAGDAALRTVGEVIRASLRLTDHAARVGGDEFGIVMPQTNADDALRVADRIRDRIQSLLLPGGARLSASFGVAAIAKAADASATELIDRADRALYLAKSQGKNRVGTGSPLKTAVI
jgi:two-component system, chemotaxis family, response regulator WspR